MFPKLFGGRSRKSPFEIKITSVNIRFMGEVHGMRGLVTGSRIFSFELPFQNKIGSDLLPDEVRGPPMKVTEIKVKEPFRLLGISPALPVSVPYLSKTMLRLSLEGPEVNYEGPLSIEVASDSGDKVSINIQKIILHNGSTAIELEDSAIIFPMQKGQVFKKDVQLYKILPYRGALNSIEVNEPFRVVSTEPKIPLVLDKKDSYVISIFMKAPDFSYAGILDLTFK